MNFAADVDIALRVEVDSAAEVGDIRWNAIFSGWVGSGEGLLGMLVTLSRLPPRPVLNRLG